MRMWEWGVRGDNCGSCGIDLVEQPVQFIEIAGLKRRLKRCKEHADGEVPPKTEILPARAHRANFTPPSGFEAPQALPLERVDTFVPVGESVERFDARMRQTSDGDR